MRLWLGVVAGVGRCSENRSLRHIHVALLLRHPWLRKFSEHRPTPARHTWHLPPVIFGVLLWKPAPKHRCRLGEAFPGVSEAMDGFSQAHMDVLVASPGKASPSWHLHQSQNSR